MEAVVVFHVSQRAFLRQGSCHENNRDGRMLIVFPLVFFFLAAWFLGLLDQGRYSIFHHTLCFTWSFRNAQ